MTGLVAAGCKILASRHRLFALLTELQRSLQKTVMTFWIPAGVQRRLNNVSWWNEPMVLARLELHSTRDLDYSTTSEAKLLYTETLQRRV